MGDAEAPLEGFFKSEVNYPFIDIEGSSKLAERKPAT
jgi:hypothetical protein